MECKNHGKYKEGIEWNRKGKMLHEVHINKKSVKRNYPNLGITYPNLGISVSNKTKWPLQVEYK